jgi:hypothetical protein
MVGAHGDMRRFWLIAISPLVLLLGACSASGVAPLSSGQSSVEPGSLTVPPAAHQTSVVASGSPAEVYTQLARGIMGCWLGASGPLRQSHIFHADVQPPSVSGGAAEILLQERDTTLRDQKGVRAFRIQITSDPGGSLVAAAALKMDPQHASAMMKDIAVWAKGGSGCELAALIPPPAPPPVAAKPSPKKAKAKR